MKAATQRIIPIMAGIFFLLKDFFSMFIIGLRFLLDLLTKDTGRSDHENNDQHKEYNCVTIAVRNQNAERFDQSNQDAQPKPPRTIPANAFCAMEPRDWETRNRGEASQPPTPDRHILTI